MKKFIKTVVFFMIGVFIFDRVSVLMRGFYSDDALSTNSMDLAYKNRNKYDVLFVGASTYIYNINCQELYEKYGIAALSLGVPMQHIPFTYFTLKNALEVQKPLLVVCDTHQSLVDSDKVKRIALGNDSFTLDHTFDDIRSFSVRQEATDYLLENDYNIDEWTYRSQIYAFHENWKRLNKFRFAGPDKGISLNGCNSANGLVDEEQVKYDLYFDESEYTEEKIKEHTEKFKSFDELQWILKMRDLCEKRGGGVKFLAANFSVTEYKIQGELLRDYLNKNGIPFYDVNEHRNDEILIQTEDYTDGLHFNLNGAIKLSNNFGEYIKDNYQLPDRRGDSRYKFYEDQREEYAWQKENLSDKVKLKKATKFKDYINELKKLDKGNNVICISFVSDSVSGLDEEGYKLLEDIGLNVRDVKGSDGYAAIISKDGVEYDNCTTGGTEVKKIIDNSLFVCTSKSKEDAINDKNSIMINDNDQIEGKNGINIVVFNTKIEDQVSSVSFNTGKNSNPDCS